ncbi:F-box/FBD/LRR-repeat protein [Actinidia chinensis var. chinensis]|uniref:F-box/FBD/LRR-repeat protein n=1 Tax=Actinidia chinensis var. chinensis TaxID=1590841 RepID=A0A2R6PLN8_ACTCC|nr:F-box/FBD/LRR-repeat protein [Actinidia chinensis var. chinensis]
MDRISQLPDSIVHGILTLLPPKEAARTSILSKAWNHMCSTNPFMAFDLSYLFNNDDHYMEEVDWLDRVDWCVQRRLQQNPNAHALKMSMAYYELSSDLLSARVARWVDIALLTSIEKLDLLVYKKTYSDNKFYLWPSVLISKSLRELRLRKCSLNGDFHVKLPQLQILSLEYVSIQDVQFFKNLSIGCPAIVDLEIHKCIWETRQRPSGQTLLQLKHLQLEMCLLQLKHLQLEMRSRSCSHSLEIKAPNLSTFWFHGQTCQCKPSEISLPDSVGLRTLELHSAKINNETFQKLMNRNPGLEVLELHNCVISSKFRISSQKLRKLVLVLCPNLSAVEIDATNLLSVTHYYCPMTLNFMATYSYHHRLKEVNIQFLLKTVDLRRLQNLKDFLMKSSHSEDFKLVAYLPNSEDMFIHEKLSDVLVSPLYHLKDLEPIILVTSMSYTNLLGHILDKRAKTVSVVCHNGKLFEFLYTNMEKETMRGRALCPFRIIWEISLDEFERFTSEQAQERIDTWKSFMQAHSVVPHQPNIMRLRWGVLIYE